MAVNVAELRLLFLDETFVHRMSTSAPPVVQQVTEHSRPDGGVYFEVKPEEEPAAMIGMNLSAEMVSLIAGVTSWGVSYSPRHPVRRALNEWDRNCRRRHRATSMQWLDHLQGPICGQMLRDVIEGGASAWWCSQRYQVPYPRAARLLRMGQDFLSERMIRWGDEQLGLVHDRVACQVCRVEEEAG